MRTDGSLQQLVPTGANDGVIDPSWGLSVGGATTGTHTHSRLGAVAGEAATCPTVLLINVLPAVLGHADRVAGRGSTSRFAHRR